LILIILKYLSRILSL